MSSGKRREAHGQSTVQKLDRRYHAIPTFGRSTICRFSDNASAMKKLAARNYEDLLQCAIPVFEGLLPEPYNTAILDLLFTCAEWHALAKLRLHTETTLGWLEQSTTDPRQQLRRFVTHTCPAFATKELPKEQAARGWRKAKKAAEAAKTTVVEVEGTSCSWSRPWKRCGCGRSWARWSHSSWLWNWCCWLGNRCHWLGNGCRWLGNGCRWLGNRCHWSGNRCCWSGQG
ncbi:uncharacterized protein LACBIDRAFT_296661 [Laccaria bicolor S238N-H82]|uniref:Predicted protein n=1 Tax=Laccaria bicolor (strain S238N-H82 / ATCC MYA-4686) TaxID=486041 RepID=B0D9D2_LACBS|nr:uncharacterized protein LACBIDRAFT_296661 [Laccaria bicolor S238N-H82]EDR09226.1 predicted protein [Laccaria bicolor S238N-H82]|eukprot:XP_001880539.1 predicted protein [Laccaria bicolor S238N-H82]